LPDGENYGQEGSEYLVEHVHKVLQVVHEFSSSTFHPLLSFFLAVSDIVAEFSPHEQIVLHEYLLFLVILDDTTPYMIFTSFKIDV